MDLRKYINYNSKSYLMLLITIHIFKTGSDRGAWVAQSVKHPTSAQVMISQSVSSSPALGSVLTAQSLEPASDSVSPSLSPPPLPAHACAISLSVLLNTLLGKRLSMTETQEYIYFGV